MTTKDQKNPQEPDKQPCLSTYKFDTSKYVVLKSNVNRDPKASDLGSPDAEKKKQGGPQNGQIRKQP